MDENALASYSSVFKNKKTTEGFGKIQIGYNSIVNRIRRKKVMSNYLDYLLDVTNLKECVIASYNLGSTVSKWLCKMLGIIDNHHVKLFDTACQFAVAKILVLFQDTCLLGDRSTDSSLRYQIYHSIDRGERFGNGGPFKTVFEILPFNQSGMYVILEKIVQLEECSIYEVDPSNSDNPSNCHNHRQMMPSTTTELQKEKVNGFFGFAIAMVIQKYDSNKRKVEYTDDERKTAEIHEISLYLRNMRILHKHAITDSNYTKNCYSHNDAMLNRGGLTLVSPLYFQFALELVEVSDEEISEQKICERKGNSYILAIRNKKQKKRK